MEAFEIITLGLAFTLLALVLYHTMKRDKAGLQSFREAMKQEEVIFLVTKIADSRQKLRSTRYEKRDVARYNLLKAKLRDKVPDQTARSLLYDLADRVNRDRNERR